MSEEDMYAKQSDRNRKARLVQLLHHMERQLYVMEAVKLEAESFIKCKRAQPSCVYESRSAYSKGGFMADYVMDEGGELLDVHYDWVRRQ